jgi:hypothetical protein
MSIHRQHREPQPPAETSAAPGTRLTDEERLAIQTAAEEEGYSEPFAELLYRFAELIGTEEVLGELKKMDPKEPGR